MIDGKVRFKRLVKDRSFRWGCGQFWVDGVNFVHKAVKQNWTLETLVYVPEKLDTDFKKDLVLGMDKSKKMSVGVDTYSMLSAREEIQGVGAVFDMKYQKEVNTEGLAVVVEHPADPGNLGSIMRSMVAFGVKNLHIVNPGVDPFSPEVVRSSMGAIFYINIVIWDGLGKISEIAKNHLNVAAVLGQAEELKKFSTGSIQKDKIWLWLGNEARGLSGHVLRLCQYKVTIPISRDVDSLNLAEAASIFLYELAI